MCLAQQVVLSIMLNNDAPFGAQQLFAVDAAIGYAWCRLCGLFWMWKRCGDVIHA